MKKNLIVGQSGGPTAVINGSLYGVVTEAMRHTEEIDEIYGMINGIEGFLNGHMMDMRSLIETNELSLLRTTPGSYLGSCRYKLPEDLNDPVYPLLFNKFTSHGIGYFFYIGGNDSMDTIKKLSDYAIITGQTQKFLGVPKTIDNDLALTDHTPGYGSAAKYIGTSMKEIIRDSFCLEYEKGVVSIVEIMGRNAGYIALWCGIANGAEDILLPEKYDYDEQKIINNIIENRKKGKKHHIIINAEGIGHSQAMAKRIEAATGIETRATILGHMQRGGSPTCKDRVYASTMGALAVDVLLEGKTKRVIGYKNGEYVDFDINEALAMQKSIPEYQYEISYSLSHNYSKND